MTLGLKLEQMAPRVIITFVVTLLRHFRQGIPEVTPKLGSKQPEKPKKPAGTCTALKKQQQQNKPSLCHSKGRALLHFWSESTSLAWFSMTKTVVCSSQTVMEVSLRQDESCRKKSLYLTYFPPLSHTAV